MSEDFFRAKGIFWVVRAAWPRIQLFGLVSWLGWHGLWHGVHPSLVNMKANFSLNNSKSLEHKRNVLFPHCQLIADTPRALLYCVHCGHCRPVPTTTQNQNKGLRPVEGEVIRYRRVHGNAKPPVKTLPNSGKHWPYMVIFQCCCPIYCTCVSINIRQGHSVT